VAGESSQNTEAREGHEESQFIRAMQPAVSTPPRYSSTEQTTLLLRLVLCRSTLEVFLPLSAPFTGRSVYGRLILNIDLEVFLLEIHMERESEEREREQMYRFEGCSKKWSSLAEQSKECKCRVRTD